jgi:Toastrack DUF4097
MTRPYGTDPYPRRAAMSRSFLPLALITLGIVFLLGNFLPDRGKGGLIVLGLGVAFLVGRVTTNRYGYAIPAGLLIAIGAYIGLQDLQLVQGSRGPGLFFVLLGSGFALAYVIGARPAAVWPLFPSVILICLGLFLFGAGFLGPLAALSWIVGYWPVALVLLGVWLMFRDHLPLSARRPVGALGGMALLGYGVVAAASTVAAQGGALARPGFGPAPFNDTLTLEDVPIAAGQTFSVGNASGPTTIRGGIGSSVHVVATRHYWMGGHPPTVSLTPSSDGVQLAATSVGSFPFGSSSWVEYEVDVPSGVNVKASASSGQLSISGISGAVQAEANSGAIDLAEIGGDLRANTSSGRIRGTQLARVRELSANSGSINVDGQFAQPASIKTSSGSVNVRLLSGSAIALDVKTSSGSIRQDGLNLNPQTQRDRSTLTGNVGSPAPGATLSIQTSSGSVLISQ